MRIYDGRKDKRVLPTNRTVSVISANRIVCGRGDHMTIRKHGRVDWSLFYCEAGRLYIDDSVLEEGQVWLYSPAVPQKYTVYSKDKTVYRYLHFTGSDIASLLSSLGIIPSSVIQVKSAAVADILDSIVKCLEDDSPLSTLCAEYHALHLISRIAKGEPHSSEMHMLKRITDKMEHSFASEYDAAHYADMLGISVSRFNHLFKEYIGIPPYAYYINLRIINACNLLEDTDLKIKDIAPKCGYDDSLYFTQAFKRALGVTPSEYRKVNRV